MTPGPSARYSSRMPRRARAAPGGLVYHVLNRANARARIFRKDADYAAFEKVLAQAHARTPTRILGYCLMPSHWHLLLWPREDGQLSEFMRWLTVTHTQRWHAHHHTSGDGHLYQGRFKSFPIQTDHHYLTVLRYVERNALRAKLVTRAQDWRHSSLTRRARADPDPLLAAGPVDLPRNWVALVNKPHEQVAAIQNSVQHSAPFGSHAWVARTAARLGLEWTLRPRGRPRKTQDSR